MSIQRSGDADRDSVGQSPEPRPSGPEESEHAAKQQLTTAASNSFLWSFAGTLAVQITAFATFVIAARALGANDLGIAAQVLTVTFWMDVMLDLGLGATIIFEQDREGTQRVRVAFTVSTAMAIVVAG